MSVAAVAYLGDMERRLFTEPAPAPPVAVNGALAPEKRHVLAGIVSNAYHTVASAMRRYGLMPQYRSTETVRAEAIEPGAGIVGGYTDGRSIALNTYTMPFLEGYHHLRYQIARMRGRFGDYLYEKFGTADSAEYSLGRTAVHEAVHQLAQLRPMRTADGGETPVIADVLQNTLAGRYSANLPKGLKWLAPYLARRTLVPVLEGMAETATENAYEGRSVGQIRGSSRDITTYGLFKKAFAGACEDMGYRDAFGAMKDLAYGGERASNAIIGGFYKRLNEIAGARCGGGCSYVAAPAQAFAMA